MTDSSTSAKVRAKAAGPPRVGIDGRVLAHYETSGIFAAFMICQRTAYS
jgi:hypothetical protein